jgi:signal transduction histidine kinase
VCHRRSSIRFSTGISRPAGKTDGAPGFGIGLSIARRNVEAMQGTIEAENRTPHGLTIHIRLPVAPRVRRMAPGGDDG